MSDGKENTSFNLYEDIKKRTNGEIYLGVVGPVRTGKSTFVRVPQSAWLVILKLKFVRLTAWVSWLTEQWGQRRMAGKEWLILRG